MFAQIVRCPIFRHPPTEQSLALKKNWNRVTAAVILRPVNQRPNVDTNGPPQTQVEDEGHWRTTARCAGCCVSYASTSGRELRFRTRLYERHGL